MKQLYSILTSFFLIYSNTISSLEMKEGNQFIKLQQPIYHAPKLLEFFSFYCPHCYQFEQIYHIPKQLQKKLPKNIHLSKYHVNFLGNLGKQLTHAWSVAIVLGIENEISTILFTAIQKQKSIHTTEDIRSIFINFGITPEKYDSTWNSRTVKSLINHQEKAARDFHLTGVPSIFVNGTYMIQNEKLDLSSTNNYIQQLSELLNLLLLIEKSY